MRFKWANNKDGVVSVRFNISHDNGGTTVDQDVVLEQREPRGDWIAYMEFHGFPPQTSPTKAAHKLGDWLERLGSQLRKHHYDGITFNDIGKSLSKKVYD